ncbi:hypothetical protein B484DRAFT_477390 [Ochromonadaceae sp. CCMP2298]|nr:hypothetical protein B484DRAFT_477390 [Ochromonadaceae sp. CCMP2298]
MLSDAAITKATGQYDKEVVARLRLECMGLQQITNLDTCFALIDLSLSRNAIGAIAGLDFCTALRRLDLSFNKIRRVEGLDALLSLDFLDLRANSIASVNDLEALTPLPELHTLFLQDSDGTNANPACAHPSYITIAQRSLPQLHILDGAHLQICDAFDSLQEHLARIQPDPALATPPLQPWLDGLLVDEGEVDVDALLGDKRFREVAALQTGVAEVLGEDCAHLLRRAQAAVTKANR